ncbi:phage tail sheath C-terminal domain-containing protein [Phenylobacterium sp.]|uniref:phage tail sheath family protein n=1 Tax=Phenylobacterium sp. TaxID=1871053 RepID=UPI00286A2267|nr:phage tail sheath C-terminal domain-containing protein [Phenylobacterium sp.]
MPGAVASPLSDPPLIVVAPTMTAFVGSGGAGPADTAVRIGGPADFETTFGPFADAGDLGMAVSLFLGNGGDGVWVVRAEDGSRGLRALDALPRIDLMALPGQTGLAAQAGALAYAEARGALLILDLPATVTGAASAQAWLNDAAALRHPNAMATFPHIQGAGAGQPTTNCGAVAGAMVRLERTRGLWKAASGIEAVLQGVTWLATQLTSAESAALALQGLNPLRRLPGGQVVIWGARTLASGTAQEEDWRYVPVRRMALFLERSLGESLTWTAVEANAEPLWAAVRQSVESFLAELWRAGAFQGATPRTGYYVRCDATTMTEADIEAGRLIVEVGTAPLKPAEFVILQISARATPPG